MIEMQDLGIAVGNFRLDGLSLRIEAGQYAVLMGRTGRGKTTILEAICGLRRIVSGKLMIHNTEMTDWPPADRQIGYVPQDLALFPNLDVRGHFEFALRLRKYTIAEIRHRTEELAEELGITHLLDRTIAGLSGGESQRVALGRALSFRPPVLLLDEPLSALDDSTRQEMYGLLKRVTAANDVTTLHVTHSEDEAKAMAEVRLCLQDGQLSVV